MQFSNFLSMYVVCHKEFQVSLVFLSGFVWSFVLAVTEKSLSVKFMTLSLTRA